MSISVADNFSYQGTKPLDARFQFNTVASMKAAVESTLYNGCFAYVTATKKYYSFDSSNTVDETTGKWREYSSGGSYAAGDGIVIDNNEISTDNMQEGDIADCIYPLPSPEPGVSSLGGLTDVVITDPEEGNALIYDEALQKWVNGQGGKVYTAGDGISIDANDEISTDNMQSADMEDVLDILPGIESKYHKYTESEQIVGEWIDGKTIYERVIDIPSLISGIVPETWTVIKTVTIPVDKMIEGYIVSGDVYIPAKLAYYTVVYEISTSSIKVLHSRSSNIDLPANSKIILQYTKS